MVSLPLKKEDVSSVIEGKSQLIEFLSNGQKPRKDWKIGTEHEMILLNKAHRKPIPYDNNQKSSVKNILQAIEKNTGWQPIMENQYIIGLSNPTGSNVSLEPGGQIEFSGAALDTIHDTKTEMGIYIKHLQQACDETDTLFQGIGFHPDASRNDVFWMPKDRYKIMRDYMPKKGNLGLDMMIRTCTVQSNIDFENEIDMVEKMRIAIALQPIATALFANSPVTENALNGYQSYRSHIWTDTDPDRTGGLDFVFDEGFGFEQYVDYVLSVPMYFILRDGKYIDFSGKSFSGFLNGDLAPYTKERPTMKDWSDHLTTIFPEVRLKQYIEMRGADSCSPDTVCGLSAFWIGLLYDKQAQDEAYQIIKNWSAEKRELLRREASKNACHYDSNTELSKELVMDILNISKSGLKRRNKQNNIGQDESLFLDDLFEIAETGITYADKIIQKM